MKNLVLVLFAALMAFVVMQGCEKEHLPLNSPQVKASKTQIQAGLYDTLYYTGANGDELVQWTVVPDGFSSISSQGNTERIIFTKEGTYTVTAQTAKAGSASVVIKVTAAPDSSQAVPVTGNLSMALNYTRNAKLDSIKFDFSIVTTDTFCSAALLQYNAAVDSAAKTYKLDVLDIKAPKTCPVGLNKVLSADKVFRNPPWFGIGTYQLKVTMNGITYSGTVVVTSTNITINWNYISGVVIPIKVISG